MRPRPLSTNAHAKAYAKRERAKLIAALGGRCVNPNNNLCRSCNASDGQRFRGDSGKRMYVETSSAMRDRCKVITKRERWQTPREFADILLALAWRSRA